jgi:hypothetical protein
VLPGVAKMGQLGNGRFRHFLRELWLLEWEEMAKILREIEYKLTTKILPRPSSF